MVSLHVFCGNTCKIPTKHKFNFLMINISNTERIYSEEGDQYTNSQIHNLFKPSAKRKKISFMTVNWPHTKSCLPVDSFWATGCSASLAKWKIATKARADTRAITAVLTVWRVLGGRELSKKTILSSTRENQRFEGWLYLFEYKENYIFITLLPDCELLD